MHKYLCTVRFNHQSSPNTRFIPAIIFATNVAEIFYTYILFTFSDILDNVTKTDKRPINIFGTLTEESLLRKIPELFHNRTRCPKIKQASSKLSNSTKSCITKSQTELYIPLMLFIFCNRQHT